MPGAGFSGAARRVVRSQLVIGATEVVRFALLLYLTSLLGRELSPADFGFVTLVPAIYLVGHVVLDLGTGALIARETSRDPARERPLLEAALCARGIAGGILGVVVAAFAAAEPDADRGFWLFVTALSLPALAPAVIGSAFRVRQDQAAPAVISIVTILLMLAATLAGMRRGVSGPAFSAIYVLREVVSGVALWIVGRARHGLVLRPGLAGRGAGAFFRAAIPQNVAVVLQIASLNVGVFGTRAFLGEDELGAYSAAWRLVSPLLLLLGALVAPLLPVLARVSRDRDAFVRLLSPSLALGGSIGALGVAFLLASGRDALRLLYDSPTAVKFSGGPLDASPPLVWLGFVFAAVGVGAVATTALLCLDGERHLRGLAIVALALNLAGFALSVPLAGRSAAAVGLLAAETWTAAAALVVLRGRLGPLLAGARLRWFAPTAVLAGAMLLLPASLTAADRVASAAGLAAFGLYLLFLFGPGRALRTALRETAA
jgi:O-antigen/teichoic acid export membrane protein